MCCLYRLQITAAVELSQLNCILFSQVHTHISCSSTENRFQVRGHRICLFSSIHSCIFHFLNSFTLNSLWPKHGNKLFSPFHTGSPNSRYVLHPCLLSHLSPLWFMSFPSVRKLQSQKSQSNCSLSRKTIQSESCYLFLLLRILIQCFQQCLYTVDTKFFLWALQMPFWKLKNFVKTLGMYFASKL